MAIPKVNVIDSAERFEAAIEAFEKRVPVPKDEWEAMTALEREAAFTVAHVTQAEVLQQVLDAVATAVRDGTDLDQFRDDVYAQLVESWGGEIPGRLETIFRTNLMTAYGEGRHAIMSAPTVKEARPYWRISAVMDDRTCEECEELHDVTLPADDQFWQTHWPPFHHNDRCTVEALSREEAEEAGIDEEAPDVELEDEDFGAAPSKQGENWDFGLERFSPDLRREVEPAVDKPEVREEALRETIGQSIADGRVGDAVHAILEKMKEVGLNVQPNPTVEVVDEIHGGLKGRVMADGGRLEVTEAMAEQAREFVASLHDDRSKVLESTNNIIESRTVEYDRKDPDFIKHVDEKTRQVLYRTFTDKEKATANNLGGLHTIVHETFHLTGPRGFRTLGELPTAIDEITTEMAARKFIHDQFGVKHPVANDLNVEKMVGYPDLTEQMRSVIAKVTGTTKEQANALLEGASVRFKSLKREFTEARDVRRAFAEFFGDKAEELATAIHHEDWEV